MSIGNTVTRKGRPPLDPDSVTEQIRVAAPRDLITLVDMIAEQQDATRSDIVRAALADYTNRIGRQP